MSKLTIVPRTLSRALIVAAVFGSTIGSFAAGTSPLVAAAGPGFTPIAGARLMDTRPGFATVDGVDAGGGIRAAGSVTRLQVWGRASVPAEASSVALNITVPDPQLDGFVTLFPCGEIPPTSTVNFVAGVTVATSAIGQLDAAGAVCLYAMTDIHLVVDVTGWFTADTITSLAPSRLLDTRPGFDTSDHLFAGQGRPPAGSTTEVPVGGRGGVPLDARAVAVTVTSTQSAGTGFVTAFGCGGRPLASTLNYDGGQTITNSALVPLAADGHLCLFTMTAAHLIVDVTGYVPAGSTFTPLAPARLVDTRFDGETVDDRCATTGRPRGSSSMTVPVSGRAGVPASGVGAVALNITALDAGTGGFVAAVPGAGSPVTTSAVNFLSGRTTANSAIVPLDSAGNVTFFVNTGVHVLVDVVGWLPGAAVAPAPPAGCSGQFVNPSARLSSLATAGSPGNQQCAITTDRKVQCWGYLPTMLGPAILPPVSVGITDAIQITGGAGGVCARRSNGTVSCIRITPLLGNGNDGVTPADVALSAPAVDISGSARLACAITTTPTLECWTTETAPVVVSAGAAPVEFFGVLSFDGSTATRFDAGTPLDRLSLRTAGGNAATVTLSTTTGTPEYRVTTSAEARPGVPWTSVLTAQPSPSNPSETCIILVDRRSACGTTAPLMASDGGDPIQRAGTALLEANGSMSDTEPAMISGQLTTLTARVPDLLGFVTTTNADSCGLVATGDVVCWQLSVPYLGTWVQLHNVALP